MRRRSRPVVEPFEPSPTRERTPAAAGGHRSSLPWVSVASGAVAVTLVVAAAGMVGAATGGAETVVSGTTAEGLSETESGVPVVTPRQDGPRPTVTRLPPPGTTTDRSASTTTDG